MQEIYWSIASVFVLLFSVPSVARNLWVNCILCLVCSFCRYPVKSCPCIGFYDNAFGATFSLLVQSGLESWWKSNIGNFSVHSRYGLSRRETPLQWNVVSHWPDSYSKWPLNFSTNHWNAMFQARGTEGLLPAGIRRMMSHYLSSTVSPSSPAPPTGLSSRASPVYVVYESHLTPSCSLWPSLTDWLAPSPHPCAPMTSWAPSQYKDCLIYVWRFPC